MVYMHFMCTVQYICNLCVVFVCFLYEVYNDMWWHADWMVGWSGSGVRVLIMLCLWCVCSPCEVCFPVVFVWHACCVWGVCVLLMTVVQVCCVCCVS